MIYEGLTCCRREIRLSPDEAILFGTQIKKNWGEIFVKHNNIRKGSGETSYARKGFLIYEEMRECSHIYVKP
jgi:hypothetical protein